MNPASSPVPAPQWRRGRAPARPARPSAAGLRRACAGILACAALLAGAAARADVLTLTETAKLLAGVDPGGGSPAVTQITSGTAWQQHRRAARAGARQLRARLDSIHRWQAQHIARDTRGRPLLYPFSGPDFVNAYALFPQAPSYVFFSLEPVGSVPALGELDAERQAGLYDDLRSALNDLVALNFFITPNMKERLQTDALQGTVPVLLAMMGLLDLQVDAVEAYDPWPQRTRQYAADAGTAHPRPALLEQGVRIRFTNPRTQRHQEIIYLALDVSDHELRYYPEFLPWLAGYEHPAVLLKSASYLLHGDHFRHLRKDLLANAAVIVQDDTGLPYKTVVDSGFAITLFGQYEQPVKLFEGRYQADLDAAYAKAGDTGRLPFPFGYNWRKEGKSGLLLAVRAAPASGAD